MAGFVRGRMLCGTHRDRGRFVNGRVNVSDHYDVIVVGLGAMGSSACYQLAYRGARVLGLEKFDIPHSHGSSVGFTRMIRLAYYEHPDYVALLRRAYELWNELEAASGQQLLHVTGGLYIGRPDSVLVAGCLRSAQEHGIAHEMLSAHQLGDRYSQFRLPDDFVAFCEQSAGFLVPERVVAVTAEQALCRGAVLRAREPVLDWQASASGVTVRTQKRRYTSDQIVFSGGAWNGTLLKDLGVELTVTRQITGWVWPGKPQLFGMDKFPCWALDFNDPDQHKGIYYGFPMTADNPGFKIALHWPMSVTDPDAVVRDVLPGDEDTFRPMLRRVFPDADGPLLSMRTCLYTNSPDSHFIVGQLPNTPQWHGRVTVACGFSGHGFKFASVIGEILADLATAGRTSLPIEFLSPSRFGK